MTPGISEPKGNRDQEISDRLEFHRSTLPPDSTEGLILEVVVGIRDRLRALESTPFSRWQDDVMHGRPHAIAQPAPPDPPKP